MLNDPSYTLPYWWAPDFATNPVFFPVRTIFSADGAAWCGLGGNRGPKSDHPLATSTASSRLLTDPVGTAPFNAHAATLGPALQPCNPSPATFLGPALQPQTCNLHSCTLSAVQAYMPVADVNSTVQAIVEQLKQAKRALGQSVENMLSKESHILCGVNGKNLLNVENYEFLRDPAHLYWTPTSTLWDRTFACLSAHGLGKELVAHMHSKGFRGIECESKTGLCMPIENNRGHSMLNSLGMGICCVPGAGDGFGGPQHPQRKLLAMLGVLWVLCGRWQKCRLGGAMAPAQSSAPARLLPHCPNERRPILPRSTLRSRTSGWCSTSSTIASLRRARARARSP